MDNTPIYGCNGCRTTGGRMSCFTHGNITIRSNINYLSENKWMDEVMKICGQDLDIKQIGQLQHLIRKLLNN